MKKAFYLLTVLVLVSCGSSDEKKAKEAVTSYLKENLDDFSRYEAVSWGRIDSFFVDLENDSFYNGWNRTIAEHEKELREMEILLSDTGKVNDPEIENKFNELKKQIKGEREYSEKYKNEDFDPFQGWIVEHKFRAPNRMGVLIMNEHVFKVSWDFSRVKIVY